MTFYINKMWQYGKTSGAASGKNGVVDGDNTANRIDPAYRGDPQGDVVDGNDATMGNVGSNDDIILARGGNDTVLAGLGNDTVVGGSGNDSIDGQSGNDVLIGDGAVAGSGKAERESFEWSKAPDPDKPGSEIDDGDNLQGGFTQNTGSVNVTFKVNSVSDSHAKQEYSDDDINTSRIDSGGETVNDDSSLRSLANSKGETSFELQFDSAVSKVSFNINDIDNKGQVQVFAYNSSGQMIDVDLQGAKYVQLSDSDGKFGNDTATSKGGDQHPDGSDYSVTVGIDGPVSRIEVIHTSTSGTSGVHVSDVYFDNPATVSLEDSGPNGDDTINGGEGDDFIFGDGAGQHASVRESFNWEGASDSQIDNGFTQDTGNVTVTYDRIVDAGGHQSRLSSRDLNTKGIDSGGETVDSDSSLYSLNTGTNDKGAFSWDFSAPVSDVSFNINDVDHDAIVKITAFDANGQPIKVDLTGGSQIVLKDTDGVAGNDTADSNGGSEEANSEAYTLNVSIAGPVSKIIVEHSQDGGSNSGINITDMYFDAPRGVMLEGGDDVLAGGSGNDTIFGEGGDDSIDGGSGNDSLEGNAGDDTISGGTGNDTIYGDTNADASGPVTGGTERESFEWDKAPDPHDSTSVDNNDNLAGGFVQNTGNVDVTFSVKDVTKTPETTFSTDKQKVHSITADSDPVNAYSSLASLADEDGERATYKLDFSKDVTNVSFRINDIDNASKVVVVAVGPDGSRTPIDVSTGSGITAQNNDGVGGNETLISKGGDGPDTTPDYSALVNIAGPVDYLEITHIKVQALSPGNHAGINITDVYFDAPVDGGAMGAGAGNDLLMGDEGDDVINGGAGNDTLLGGADSDTLDGGTGRDSLDGGAGADSVMGGDDQDTIVGGTDGDYIDGGAGGYNADDALNTDDDTLDLTGVGNFRIIDKVADSNGNGFNGTVVLYDTDGITETGRFEFAEIEKILGTPAPGPVDGLDSDENMGPGYTDLQGDQIDGTDGINDTIFGNGGDDTIDSGLGDDTVYGGSGDDTFALTDKIDNDVIVGGETGETNGDSLDSSTINDDLTLNFTAPEKGTLSDGTNTTSFEEIEAARLGGGDDTVTGSEGGENVSTGGGNDSVQANGGHDTVDGQGGDDTISGGGGDDSITGGDGRDVLGGGDGDDVIYGNNPGSKGVPDADVPLINRPFDQDTDPNNDKDTIFGGAGNDTIDGGDDADLIDGGIGDDVIEGGIDNDTIQGGDGNDTITDIQGADSISGGDGDDLIVAGVDTFSDYPDDQPTYFNPLTGRYEANPYYRTGDPNQDDGRDFVDGGAGNDTIRTGDDADTVYGGTGNDYINAGIDDDYVEGGDGNDYIVGSHGSDTLKGNDGNDTIYGGFGAEFVPGYASEEPDATDVQPNNGKDLIDGGAGDDVLYGEDDDDTIFGGSGNDAIYGGVDNDSLDGGQGNDSIFGGQGDDIIIGAQGDDVIDGGDGNDSILAGNDNDSVKGGAGNDTIDGGQGNDTIDGGDGDDSIAGGFGEDSIMGGAGNDTIFAAGDNDTVDGGDGDDSISGVRGDDLLVGGAGNDTIDGGEDNDTLKGDAGDDSLMGGFGDDSIVGGDGDDIISGGGNNDTILGGAGNDSMRGDDGQDTFRDVNGGDTIDGGSGTDASDYDVIDLTGSLNGGGYYLDNVRPDNDPGDTIDGDSPNDGIDGTIVFTDASGTETGRLDFTNIEKIIPCFTPGTLIATPKGERKVEDLEVGDRVITRDNGIQEIRWIGSRAMSGDEFARSEHLRPVLIRQGALGKNLPERDMMVSPNHRVLVANDKTALYFEEREVLVAAKHLTGLEGVDIVEVSGTTYIHVMFDQHEVILSDGTWTESFQPGDMSLAGVGNAQRNEILEIFPELATREGVDGYMAARRTLKKHEAKLLTR